MKTKKAIILFIIICINILMVSCSNNQEENFDVDCIKVSINNISKLQNGTYYSIEVFNDSNQNIKHLDLDFGFYLNEEGKKATAHSSFMVPAKTEKEIDIGSGEKAYFTAYWSKDIFKEEMFNMDVCIVHIIGYTSEINIDNRFEIEDSIDYFSKD